MWSSVHRTSCVGNAFLSIHPFECTISSRNSPCHIFFPVLTETAQAKVTIWLLKVKRGYDVIEMESHACNRNRYRIESGSVFNGKSLKVSIFSCAPFQSSFNISNPLDLLFPVQYLKHLNLSWLQCFTRRCGKVKILYQQIVIHFDVIHSSAPHSVCISRYHLNLWYPCGLFWYFRRSISIRFFSASLHFE